MDLRKGFTISELVTVLALVALVFALLTPAITLIHRRMLREGCADNLREMGTALYIYAREHEGRFPTELRELFAQKYLTDEDVLDCPASEHVGTLSDPDYFYTGGLSITSPSKAPLLRDKEGNHAGGRKNMLNVKGEILFE